MSEKIHYFRTLEEMENWAAEMFAIGKVLWLQVCQQERFLAEVLDYGTDGLHFKRDNAQSAQCIWNVLSFENATADEIAEFKTRLAQAEDQAVYDTE